MGQSNNKSVNNSIIPLKDVSKKPSNNKQIDNLKLSNSNLKVIRNNCGEEYVKRYKGIINRFNNDTVKIVNTGMVSSGKSSLFNVLIDSTDKEHFPTGAARTTKLADAFNYKNISFIDTPGFDVREEDDEVAFNTIMEADIIMIIHNIKTGPLNRSEIEWIERITQHMVDVRMCQERMIFVSTWKDAREKDEDYDNIIKDVKEQLRSVIKGNIPFFEVSVKKYLTGINKGKDALKESSGIPKLQTYIEKYAQTYIDTKEQLNTKELQLLVSEIKDIITKKKTDAQTNIDKITEDIYTSYDKKRNLWSQVFKTFKDYRESLKDAEKDYTNEFGSLPNDLMFKNFF